jgi:menaquinone-9 beta-reductase
MMDANGPTPADRSVLEAEVWDAAVVGAGPSGSMVARELARQGLRVVLLERQEFPRWKVCGACLSPGALEVLRRAGLEELPAALGARSLRVLRLRGWSLQAEVALRGSLALSRGVFDTALVEAARVEGAVFAPGAPARLGAVRDGVVRLEVGLAGGAAELTARVVVAADGLRSEILSRSVGSGSPGRGGAVRARTTGGGSGKLGLGAVFEGQNSAYGDGIVHMAVGEEGYVGMVRTEDRRLNVAAAVRRSALGRGRSPGQAVARILRQASLPGLEGYPTEGWSGTPDLSYHPVSLGTERIFAVGNAAGYVEPFTGEGMGWALAGGWTLAPIVARATRGWTPRLLEEWCDAYRSTVGRAQRLCKGVAWVLDRPRFSRSALHLLTMLPQAAAPFVGAYASSPPLHARRFL